MNLTRHGHVFLEQQPNGTFNVYPASMPIATGVSPHDAMQMAQGMFAPMSQMPTQPFMQPVGAMPGVVVPGFPGTYPQTEDPSGSSIVRGGQQISPPVPLWAGDPRLFAIRIPVRMATSPEDLSKLPAERRSKRIIGVDARKLVATMTRGAKVVPKGAAVTPRSTSEAGSVEAGGRRQYWAFRLRRAGMYVSKHKPIMLPNGIEVVIGEVARDKRGETKTRALRGLPPAEELVKILKSMSAYQPS